MADELVLPASVTDKFSKPLTDLSNKLKNLRPSPALQATQRHFVELRKQVESVGAAMKNAASGLASGMGLPGLSLGALSAAGAMAALGASVQSFAKNAVEMRSFNQDTGIAVQKLKELQAVAAGLNISPDAISGGLAFSAHNADAMRRRQGNYAEIANLGPGGMSIANDLANTKTNDEVVNKQLRYLNKQKTAEQRRTLARLFFGDESFAGFGANGQADLDKRMANAKASAVAPSAKDQKNAEAFLDATSKVSLAFDNLKNAIGAELAPELTAFAESIGKIATSNLGGVHSFFEDVRAFVDRLNSVKVSLDGAADSLNKAGRSIIDGLTGKGKVEDRPPGPVQGSGGAGAAPDPNAGKNGAFFGNDRQLLEGSSHYSPIAYRPGARMGLQGINDTREAAMVAIIGAGVLKGLQDYAATFGIQQPRKDGSGGGSGGTKGVINAAYNPAERGLRMGGGGQGGSMD